MSLVGFSVVIVRMQESGSDHFSPSNYVSGVGGAHVIIGIIIVILTILQVIGGILIDKWFDPNRTEVPFSDKLHWWLGRILLLTGTQKPTNLPGMANVLLGLRLYVDVDADANLIFFYVILGWTCLIVLLFVILSFTMKAKVH